MRRGGKGMTYAEWHGWTIEVVGEPLREEEGARSSGVVKVDFRDG